MTRSAEWLERAVLAAALAIFVFGAAGGPGWAPGSGEAILATGLERTAGAPLYGILAGIAAHVPVGEPAFRLAVLNAVLGVVVLAGVLRAARALLPRDPIAGGIGVILLALAPPFRDAAGFAGPSILAAAGSIWAIACAAEHARAPSARRAAGAIAAIAVVVGSAPWLGAALALAVFAWLAPTTPRRVLAGGAAGIGALIVVWWADALGALPGPTPSLTATVAATGRGAAAVVVGAGLLGIAFAAATRLAFARWLALAAVIAAGHAIAFDHAPAPLLAVLAVGCAVVPGAVVRAVASERRHLVAAAAGLPLAGAALATGPALRVDDPGDAPARLADDVIGALPPGPGVVVATRDATFGAIQYAQLIGGARPDLALVPPLAPTSADAVVANALRGDGLAGADVAAFGRLDPRLALPRGRGFQLFLEEPAVVPPVPPPAQYASEIGAEEARSLALARARFEATVGRLDAAARAAGLADRFRAADLAILAVAATSAARPALFGFVPSLGTPPGPWRLELFGDDLAWAASLAQPELGPDQPPERRLHALWRKLWLGELRPSDPAIAALGPRAVAATWTMLRELERTRPAPSAEP